MLDERKAAILQAVVQEYIRTAQPVGSNHVVAASAIDVSPATVRNEMAALEADGYLQQPHTSAGRVPTDKGYRFFVDTLAQPGPLDSGRAQQVRTFFAHAHGALEQMLSDTSQLLTRLTRPRGVGRRRPRPSRRRFAACSWCRSPRGSSLPSRCSRTGASSVTRSSSAPS